jgi:hypothetical protein
MAGTKETTNPAIAAMPHPLRDKFGGTQMRARPAMTKRFGLIERSMPVICSGCWSVLGLGIFQPIETRQSFKLGCGDSQHGLIGRALVPFGGFQLADIGLDAAWPWLKGPRTHEEYQRADYAGNPHDAVAAVRNFLLPELTPSLLMLLPRLQSICHRLEWLTPDLKKAQMVMILLYGYKEKH